MTELKPGDKVLIEAEITDVYANDYVRIDAPGVSNLLVPTPSITPITDQQEGEVTVRFSKVEAQSFLPEYPAAGTSFHAKFARDKLRAALEGETT